MIGKFAVGYGGLTHWFVAVPVCGFGFGCPAGTMYEQSGLLFDRARCAPVVVELSFEQEQ